MQKEFGDQEEEKEGKTYVAGVILVGYCKWFF